MQGKVSVESLACVVIKQQQQQSATAAAGQCWPSQSPLGYDRGRMYWSLAVRCPYTSMCSCAKNDHTRKFQHLNFPCMVIICAITQARVWADLIIIRQ